MAFHRHEIDWVEVYVGFLVTVLYLAVAILVVCSAIALCYTIIWHIGHWVNWW